ncbi:MAG: ErfK/YbiS/YcfS/YnhG family protein [Frankiales bacterium]|nr:ErfK/YbiS/YcfS/YnhG family protein [Frankiales bacterium]MCW2709636.1 ErfK/YbiS/YcfS/YnhG family protein [Frankiales bacterium]
MLRRSPLLARVGLAALVLGLAVACTHGATTAVSPLPGASGSPVPAATPVLQALQQKGTTVPWSKPLTLSATNGTLTAVTATGPGGAAMDGTLINGTWTSAATLVPARSYAVAAQVKDADGKTRTLDETFVASNAQHVLHATISPGSHAVVGVAQPVIVRFDQKVSGRANRLAVLSRLNVTTTPAVVGAWRWYNSYEVHYHGAKYWASGTTVAVHVDLGLLHLAGTTTWGSTRAVDDAFTVGKDYESIVDISAHVMRVYLDHKLIRTIKVSTGRDQYPTKGGVHIVLTREKSHIYNSGTVGIPTNGPGGYYETLPWSMRISNGGAFVHANPQTVGVQGLRNVSHGCVNTSVTDAKWFYYHSQLGDPVNIIHAVVKPVTWDAGMADWNYTWAEWKSGNLDG